MQDKQSSILYNALTLYLQDTKDRIDYRTQHGLPIGELQDRRTIAATMRDKARQQMIEVRIARQDRMLQDSGKTSDLVDSGRIV